MVGEWIRRNGVFADNLSDGQLEHQDNLNGVPTARRTTLCVTKIHKRTVPVDRPCGSKRGPSLWTVPVAAPGGERLPSGEVGRAQRAG